MSERMVSLYRQYVIERPRTVLLLVAILVVGFAAGLPNFRLDASADSLTLESDTDLDYFREVIKRYQSGDFLVITFKPKADLLSDESISLLQDLVAELKQVEGVTSTLSMLDAPLLYSPKVSLTEITEPRTLLTEGVDRAEAKQEFLNSPIYREMILGPDGQTTAIMLNLRVDQEYIRLVIGILVRAFVVTVSMGIVGAFFIAWTLQRRLDVVNQSIQTIVIEYTKWPSVHSPKKLRSSDLRKARRFMVKGFLP